jgi:hypothetical protein
MNWLTSFEEKVFLLKKAYSFFSATSFRVTKKAISNWSPFSQKRNSLKHNQVFASKVSAIIWPLRLGDDQIKISFFSTKKWMKVTCSRPDPWTPPCTGSWWGSSWTRAWPRGLLGDKLLHDSYGHRRGDLWRPCKGIYCHRILTKWVYAQVLTPRGNQKIHETKRLLYLLTKRCTNFLNTAPIMTLSTPFTPDVALATSKKGNYLKALFVKCNFASFQTWNKVPCVRQT